MENNSYVTLMQLKASWLWKFKWNPCSNNYIDLYPPDFLFLEWQVGVPALINFFGQDCLVKNSYRHTVNPTYVYYPGRFSDQWQIEESLAVKQMLTSRTRKWIGGRCMQTCYMEQVKIAEVQKPKYGNRSTETEVWKWEEKLLSVSSALLTHICAL